MSYSPPAMMKPVSVIDARINYALGDRVPLDELDPPVVSHLEIRQEPLEGVRIRWVFQGIIPVPPVVIGFGALSLAEFETMLNRVTGQYAGAGMTAVREQITLEWRSQLWNLERLSLQRPTRYLAEETTIDLFGLALSLEPGGSIVFIARFTPASIEELWTYVRLVREDWEKTRQMTVATSTV